MEISGNLSPLIQSSFTQQPSSSQPIESMKQLSNKSSFPVNNTPEQTTTYSKNGQTSGLYVQKSLLGVA